MPVPDGLSDRYEALHRLTHTRYDLVQDIVRAKQRFLNAMFLKGKQLAQDKPVGRTLGANALAYTVEAECAETLAAMCIEELTDRVLVLDSLGIRRVCPRRERFPALQP